MVQSCQFRELTFFPFAAAFDQMGSPCFHQVFRLPSTPLPNISLVLMLNI